MGYGLCLLTYRKYFAGVAGLQSSILRHSLKVQRALPLSAGAFALCTLHNCYGCRQIHPFAVDDFLRGQ
jgi:hypothetical protein